MIASEYELIDETLQMVNSILEILQFPLEIHPQSLDALYDEKIYIEIANVLFPYLQYNLLQISKKKLSVGEKIGMLIKVLEHDIVKQPLSNINGEAVARGDIQHVYNLVEVLYQLTKRHASNQDGSGNNEEEEDSEHVHSVLGINQEFADEDDENPQSNKDSPEQPKRKYEHLLEGQQIIDEKLNQLRNHQRLEQKKSDDSSGFGEVLQRKHFDVVSPSKQHQIKSNKSLKQTIKKQIQNRLFSNNTKKKLTAKLRNAVSEKRLLSPKQKQFANEAYEQISKARAEVKPSDEYELLPKKDDTLERKAKQFKQTIKDYKQKERLKGMHNNRKATLSASNNLKKIHYLKVDHLLKQVRQQQQKKRIEEHERAVEMKLRDQKCRYIRKMNGLVQKLEKDRNVDERRQFRERLLQENRSTAQRLQALEIYYLTEMNLLKEKEQSQKKDRRIVENAHRSIVNKLEHELRKENELKLARLQQRYLQQYNRMTDFEAIEGDLIRLYKKY